MKRAGARRATCVATLIGMLLMATSASGVEFFDRRLQIHGFYEMQVRSIMRDFSISDGWDLTQWYNVLNLEIEADIAPDGWGPFDLVSGFGRIEVRYDCVWTSGCTIFNSANTYGNKSKKMPKRLSDGRRNGYQGTKFNGDLRRWNGVPFNQLPGNPARSPRDARLADRFGQSQQPGGVWQTSTFAALFGSNSYGPDGQPWTEDDRALFYFQDYTGVTPSFNLMTDVNSDSLDCTTWTVRNVLGRVDFNGNETLPHSPQCNPITIGANRHRPNPYSSIDSNPLLGGATGSGALPFRPAPKVQASNYNANTRQAQGIYYPNARLQELIVNRDLAADDDQRFREDRLAWNMGASQKEQRFLKELYVDLEMFDSRLWIRAGYQTIVWGKTELFRNQDQFNPVDLALGSLTSLEESRISLWAIRGIWSFYDVGPLQDVRLEIAMNYDGFEPTDIGVCGEPYAPLAICGAKVGLLANGLTGAGLAGTERVDAPWAGIGGIEVGGRLEFRWDRFSFAITDFYGFQDFFHVQKIFTYSRNVDPYTGRPRELESTGSCSNGRGKNCLTADEALTKHSVNQELFALICGSTIGVSDLDPGACLANVFSSPALALDPETDPPPIPFIVVAINSVLLGDPAGQVLPGLGRFTDNTTDAINMYSESGNVLTTLNIDANDGGPDYPADHPIVQDPNWQVGGEFFYDNLQGGSLSARLTDEQEALLGCGAFYDTSCDTDGIDLLNMEASMAFMSWSMIEGTTPGAKAWLTTSGAAQPGTVGFQGGPRCTRYENGRLYKLPGCRGPGEDGYSPGVDGTTDGLLHPFTGQQFQNELAALSWNFQMFLVANSIVPEGEKANDFQFDPEDSFREDGCSFNAPSFCSSVAALIGLAGVNRNDIRAGGNARYGRRDFTYHSGASSILAFDKANIFGFSMDFAEDFTKTNWGVEFTWTDGVNQTDNNSFTNLSEVNLYRLTVSMDRPTFVNFLNSNRTFFINTQWFFEYIQGYSGGFTTDGPWNIFGVFAVGTGYFQDRLLPNLTMVYFVGSNSFGILPSVTYRFTEAFSATFGVAAFAGRTERRVLSVSGLAPTANGVGGGAYNAFTNNGLSAIRERDEVFLRIKWTF